jgi:hypothetical protein
MVTVFYHAHSTSHPPLRKAVRYYRKSNILTILTRKIELASAINNPTMVLPQAGYWLILYKVEEVIYVVDKQLVLLKKVIELDQH